MLEAFEVLEAFESFEEFVPSEAIARVEFEALEVLVFSTFTNTMAFEACEMFEALEVFDALAELAIEAFEAFEMFVFQACTASAIVKLEPFGSGMATGSSTKSLFVPFVPFVTLEQFSQVALGWALSTRSILSHDHGV